MMIVEEVRRRGSVRVSELTEQLGVSEMTVRRDLDALAQSGLIEKVHGGATTRMRLTADEPGFEVNSHRQLPEKEAIANAAAELVRPGQAIAFSGGTTTWRLARRIRRTPNLTVVTNSLQVADVLHAENWPDLTVVITEARTPSGRARRPDRGADPPDTPRRRPVHGRARDDRGRRVHHAQPSKPRPTRR